jgi:hypothetical protein
MIDKREVPSISTLGRVVFYLAAVVALGMSFSFTLDLLNTEFGMGVVGTLINVGLSAVLIRYVAVKHFINPDSQ